MNRHMKSKQVADRLAGGLDKHQASYEKQVQDDKPKL